MFLYSFCCGASISVSCVRLVLVSMVSVVFLFVIFVLFSSVVCCVVLSVVMLSFACCALCLVSCTRYVSRLVSSVLCRTGMSCVLCLVSCTGMSCGLCLVSCVLCLAPREGRKALDWFWLGQLTRGTKGVGRRSRRRCDKCASAGSACILAVRAQFKCRRHFPPN